MYLFKVNNKNTKKKMWNMFKVNNKNPPQIESKIWWRAHTLFKNLHNDDLTYVNNDINF